MCLIDSTTNPSGGFQMGVKISSKSETTTHSFLEGEVTSLPLARFSSKFGVLWYQMSYKISDINIQITVFKQTFWGSIEVDWHDKLNTTETFKRNWLTVHLRNMLML